MSNLMKVSSNPHIRSKVTSGNIMLAVVIALLPAAGFGIYNFGLDALILILITVATTVLTEYLYEKLMHKKVTTGDFSAAVTGLLLALNLPPAAPWWIAVIGGVFAILVVKMLFGGLGQLTQMWAFERALVGEINIYGYSGILFSMLFGRLFLGERVTAAAAAGGCLVIAAGVWSYLAARRQQG